MERDCESELSKLNIEQNACIYHFGASVIHGQRSNILRLRFFAKEKRCRNLLTPLHSLILTLRFMQTIYINANLHYSFSFISSVAFVSICLYCSFKFSGASICTLPLIPQGILFHSYLILYYE